MTSTGAKYINPFIDFGFIRFFGEEANKHLLLDFLNEVLRDVEGEIVEITYLPTKELPFGGNNRLPIFDLYCTNEKGENFIVEIQKIEQKYYRNRLACYSSFPIYEKFVAGEDWNFELRNVYLIAILNFVFDEDKEQPDKFRYDVQLSDIETHKVFYDKLTFVYFEMPKFNKKEDELKTKYDKWLFVLKNLSKLDRIPLEIKESIFIKLFEIAEIARLDEIESAAFHGSWIAYLDIKNCIDTAREEGENKYRIQRKMEGKIEGKIEGKMEVARNLLKLGFDIEITAKITELSKEEIESLKKASND